MMKLSVGFPDTDRVILASQSPRRREILKPIFPSIEIVPSDVTEIREEGEHPAAMAERLALKKCKRVYGETGGVAVLGADTVVAIGDHIFGKPASRKEAVEMLMTLSGETHEVHTGVGVCVPGDSFSFFETTTVTFHNTRRQLIEWYVETHEPMDKAGAYGIQGKGALLVKSIRGDYLNVVGFPLSTFMQILWEKGYTSFHE